MENKYQEALRRIELIKITENYDTKHVLNIGVHEIDQIEEALKEAVAIEPEYRELKAKNTPRKIMFKEGCPQCPYCGRFNTTYNPYLGNYKHCCYCGQALDWSAEEDWNKKQEALNKAKVVKCGEIHWHDCIIGVEDTHCPNHISTPFSKDDNHYGLILLDKSYWEENK